VNALDLTLLLIAVLYALAGYRQGFVIGALSTAGLLLSGAIGIAVAPLLLDRYDPSVGVSFAALLIVITLAFLGQALGAQLGALVRDRITWRPARVTDAVSGALLSVSAMLIIAWVLALAVSGTQLRTLNQEVRESRVLGAVNDVVPGSAASVLKTFNRVVGSSHFPRYLEPFAPERIKQVPAPLPSAIRDRKVRLAQASVVKIVGDARSCNRAQEGSGFVFAPGRVMTNAHVVAGVDEPAVLLGNRRYHAVVVYYDPKVDIGVLSVNGLQAIPLKFAGVARSGASGAVLGYPENGGFDAEPARIREERRLLSPNIYGGGRVIRDTYSVYSKVRPGNSGGPLVNLDGKVWGVVFAASVTDAHTGYALTSRQVSLAASLGARATRGVDTGGCAN
jgi:S1-C subfamily serine protease